jgi:hypothetical protein
LFRQPRPFGRGHDPGFGGAGAHVIVNGRDASALDRFAQDLRREGLSVEPAAFDAHDVAKIHGFFGGLKRLDVLVNNIGKMAGKSFSELGPDDFAATYAATVTSTFETVRAVLPALKQAVSAGGDASVINISSIYGQVAPVAGALRQARAAEPVSLRPRQGRVGTTHPPPRRRAGTRQDSRQHAGAGSPFPSRGKCPQDWNPGWRSAPCWAVSAPAGEIGGAASVPGRTGLVLHDGRLSQHRWRLDRLVTPKAMG